MASVFATFSFFILLKISMTAISFYQCNDTSIFRHLTEFIPHISSSLRLLVLYLLRHTLLFVYFFKELISFIGSLDKCHTSVFKALVVKCVSSYQLKFSQKLVPIPDLNETIDFRFFMKPRSCT